MKLEVLPFSATIDEYDAQAAALLAAHRVADAAALDMIHNKHPRFLDEKVRWLPKPISIDELAAQPFTLADARLVVARRYDFLDWAALAEHVAAASEPGSPVHELEAAVNAVVTGNVVELRAALGRNGELVRARSVRRTHFDPAVHGATLLHYLAANGVEGHNQRSPANAVDVARLLLDAGAEPDALAAMYGGRYTTLSMLVSSTPPARAGVQVPLVEVLAEHGATIEPSGSAQWGSPLFTALAFGFVDAAEALVRLGATIDLATAAGLGRYADVERQLATADAANRHRALALAAQIGHVHVVRLLLDAGEDPDRYNPESTHAHSTPLHQAALAGHDAVVQLLVERGARLDIEDTLWHGTPLGWAEHAGKTATAAYLREAMRRD